MSIMSVIWPILCQPCYEARLGPSISKLDSAEPIQPVLNLKWCTALASSKPVSHPRASKCCEVTSSPRTIVAKVDDPAPEEHDEAIKQAEGIGGGGVDGGTDGDTMLHQGLHHSHHLQENHQHIS